MRKLRIAQVTSLQESVPPLNKNGLEQVVYYLTEELVKMGHDVTLFATADSKTSAKLVPIWPIAVSRDKLCQNLPGGTYAMWSVFRCASQASEFDIIHDHTRFHFPLLTNLIKTPVISTLHHPLSDIREQGFREIFPESYQSYLEANWNEKRVSVQSVGVSHSQMKKYQGACSVIHNGVPLESFPFSRSPGNHFTFLGYINQDKGASQAIQSILKTSEKLLIAGPIRENDRNSQNYFENEIKPFLGNQIQYLGGLNFEEKIQLLKNSKAVLMPIQWDEPFGMVAIESMACGTPAIAWNRAAMPEIIENEKTGFLVNSIEEMADKINQIDKIDRPFVRQKTAEKFSSSLMARKYEEFYFKILNQLK